MDKITDIVFTDDELILNDAVEKVSSEFCGATSVFIGTTRDVKNGRNIVKLEYECYKEMARKEMMKICNRVREQWKEVKHIVIWHRLGPVPVKEASVVIAVSAPHRVDAMNATQQCIDMLKAHVPIWKKEIYNDGTSEWMENKECSWNEKNVEINDLQSQSPSGQNTS